MTTLRTRSLVSLVAALTVAFTLGGCASAPSHLASAEPESVEAASPTIRFDNEARDYVHVYLVGEQREWLLGRVEPGARAMLPIPDAALAGNPWSMRLVVLAGKHVTQRAVSEPGAAITIPQPAAGILSQRWSFSQTIGDGQIKAFELDHPRVGIGRQ